MKLLLESIGTICESEVVQGNDGHSIHKISGIWMQAERKNRNGRVYPREVLQEAVMEYQENIHEGCSWGELDHPEDLNVNFRRASHLITKLEMIGDDVYGEAVIMSETENGRILKDALRIGGKVGVSSRGAGDIRMVKGTPYVENGFKLVTVDAVSKPSAHNAYVRSLQESCEFEYNPETKSFEKKTLIKFNEENVNSFFGKLTQIMRKK